MTDDCWLAKTLTQISAQWYSWQTWLISVHYSQKTLHFLTVSSGPTSVLSDILITLRKPHEIILWDAFFIIYDFWWRASYVFETSQRRHGKDIFFEMFLRRLKGVTKKTSFLRCIWDVSRTSQKVISFEMFARGHWDVSLNGDLIEISQRHFLPAG